MRGTPGIIGFLDDLSLRLARLREYIVGEASALSVQLADPLYYGPRMARSLASITKKLLLASLALSLASPFPALVDPKLSALTAASALLLLALSHLFPRLWRLVLGMGVDKEVPAVLAYTLPYSAGPKYLSDILAHAPDRVFPWFRYEADRLRFIISTGRDPVTALRLLSKTTPSRRLRAVLLDYIHSHEVGAPRSQSTMRLLEAAVGEVRAQWRSYVDAGRGIVEALTALVMASSMIAPMALVAGSMNVDLALAPLLLTPAASLALLMMRPRMGDYRPDSLLVTTLLLTVPLIVVVIAFHAGLAYAITVGVAASVVAEAVSRRFSRLEEESLQAIKEAADNARYRRYFEAILARARGVAGGVVDAVIEASRFAGKIGVGQALIHIYRVVDEARTARTSVKGQALVLGIVASIAPAVAIYVVMTVTGIASGNPLVQASPSGLEELARALASLSPLAPLPATVLKDGWIPRPLLSTLALAASAAVLGS